MSLLFGLLRCEQQEALVRYFMHADMQCVRVRALALHIVHAVMERMRMCRAQRRTAFTTENQF